MSKIIVFVALLVFVDAAPKHPKFKEHPNHLKLGNYYNFKKSVEVFQKKQNSKTPFFFLKLFKRYQTK